MVGNIIALLTFCIYNIVENYKFAVDGTQFVILNVITIVFGLVFYFVIRFLVNMILKKIVQKRSNVFYENIDSKLHIGFDSRSEEFQVGKDKSKIRANNSLLVHSSARNFLFYVGNGRSKDEKFYIPKEGTVEHQQRLKRVITKLEESGIRVMPLKEK